MYKPLKHFQARHTLHGMHSHNSTDSWPQVCQGLYTIVMSQYFIGFVIKILGDNCALSCHTGCARENDKFSVTPLSRPGEKDSVSLLFP